MKIKKMVWVVCVCLFILAGCGNGDNAPVTAKKENTYENNGHYYVCYNDEIYYREYNNESEDEVALWGYYDYIPGVTCEIKKINKIGNIEKLFTDIGNGNFYIVDDRFFGADINDLYTIDLTGKNQRTIAKGRYLGVDEKNHKVYYESHEEGDLFSIYEFDTQKLTQKKVATDEGHEYASNLFVYDNAVYFENYHDEKNKIYLEKYDFENNQYSEVAVMQDARAEEDLADFEFFNGCMLDEYIRNDNKFFALVGIREGSGGFFEYGNLYEVDLKTGDTKLLKSGVYPSIVLDNDTLYYKTSDNMETIDKQNYESINTSTGELKYEGTIETIDDAKDGMKVSIVADGLKVTYKDGTSKKILDLEGLRALEEKYLHNYEPRDRDFSIKYIEIVDGKIFYTIEMEVYEEEADIGWRPGYRHVASEYHMYDIEKDKDTILYAYTVYPKSIKFEEGKELAISWCSQENSLIEFLNMHYTEDEQQAIKTVDAGTGVTFVLVPKDDDTKISIYKADLDEDGNLARGESLLEGYDKPIILNVTEMEYIPRVIINTKTADGKDRDFPLTFSGYDGKIAINENDNYIEDLTNYAYVYEEGQG